MKTTIIYFFPIVISWGLLSCDKNTGDDAALKTWVHENSLNVRLDRSIAAISSTENGFRIKFKANDIRSVNELEIQKYDYLAVDLSLFKVRKIEGVKYYYKEESVSSGSGGDEYTYLIWKFSGNGGVLLSRCLQQESTADFNLAWETTWEIIKNSE